MEKILRVSLAFKYSKVSSAKYVIYVHFGPT